MIRGRRSPPKHRHDGTSPLPMCMDWSPPPKIWNGRYTLWPHDPRTGWSYCVTIPSWVALPKSRTSASDPVVFYRVQVGIQSPEGITTTRGVLRRFNDFLKLFSDLKKAFPKRTLPAAPPKGLLRMKSRALLEERRYSLEEWISKLLSDIHISRSMPVASFLELEAAARTSFEESTTPSTSNRISSPRVYQTLTPSSSLASDYGSDTVYEASELGSPSFGRDDVSEAGMSNIEEGLLLGENILHQLEGGLNKDEKKVNTRHVTDGVNGVLNHTRMPSDESIESDLSELSNLWAPHLQSLSGGEVLVPKDQQAKLDRVLMVMERRLVTAKTDMEDLISRLNQEIAVKEFLQTRVKDLEVELESTKEKSKETIQQAVYLEQDRITKMQWDMEELKRKSFDMESKLKSHENPKNRTGSGIFSDEEELLKELEETKTRLDNLRKQHQDLERKAKSDVKILVKEVKSLRKSQNELKEKLQESLQSKSLLERQLQQEMERSEQGLDVREKLLRDCQTLLILLQLCDIKLTDDDFVAPSSSSVSKVLHLLSESDKQVGLLLVKTQGLAPDTDPNYKDSDEYTLDHELRFVLRDIIYSSAKLRKQVNIFIRSAFQTDVSSSSRQSLHKQVLHTPN